uniref:Uncharacterized protein TCIL3000_6_630 n=1 Tax=Trypanosoma congolense (strain IL3000) TaxID=1068625 RepID=G0UN77_TRYCI|nr:unnamed protein product [Trypanosoma congolense IL3000]
MRSRGLDCAMPLPFKRGVRGATCRCGADGVNDLNKAIPEQYVRNVTVDCDIVLDTRSSTNLHESFDFPSDVFKHEIPGNKKYWLLDVERTPMWCRVLYYPLGISERCTVMKEVVLLSKQNL